MAFWLLWHYLEAQRWRISQLHPAYSSLHYVLLFPHGEDGWHPAVPAQVIAERRCRSDTVTQHCYYAYRFHPRPGEQPLLLWGGNLFQEFVVDAWAFVEQSTLNWVRFHQKELWADVYSGIRDAVLGDREENINLAEHGRSLHLATNSYRNPIRVWWVRSDWVLVVCQPFFFFSPIRVWSESELSPSNLLGVQPVRPHWTLIGFRALKASPSS